MDSLLCVATDVDIRIIRLLETGITCWTITELLCEPLIYFQLIQNSFLTTYLGMLHNLHNFHNAKYTNMLFDIISFYTQY